MANQTQMVKHIYNYNTKFSLILQQNLGNPNINYRPYGSLYESELLSILLFPLKKSGKTNQF